VSAQDLPTPHIRLVFAALMLRAELMPPAEFESELTATYGPIFGPAIAEHVAAHPAARTPTPRRAAHRGDRTVPRRL